MLSQKLQDDLIIAYQKVYEEKRGHAAGSSDVEKQASQLASDVRYKAKGKVKPGASDEEKKKVFLQILGASPAPNAVKAMARQKLIGEEVVQEMRFNDGKEGTEKRKEALRKKRGLTKDQMDKHPQFKTEGTSYGITRGSGKPSGPMAGFAKEEETDTPKEKLAKKMKAKKVNKMLTKAAKSEKKLAKELMGEMKAPRMQKGAMAYDGPNKERSEAADRVLAKAKKKREKMKEEYVGEMKVKQVVKPKPARNPQNMALPKGVKSGVNYQNMAQSYVPVGNIFNEKKMDPVGQEDKDIDNDGDHDSTDKYLLKRRKAIGKAIAKKRGRVKEGFSAWRIDLDFNEQVKK